MICWWNVWLVKCTFKSTEQQRSEVESDHCLKVTGWWWHTFAIIILVRIESQEEEKKEKKEKEEKEEEQDNEEEELKTEYGLARAQRPWPSFAQKLVEGRRRGCPICLIWSKVIVINLSSAAVPQLKILGLVKYCDARVILQLLKGEQKPRKTS